VCPFLSHTLLLVPMAGLVSTLVGRHSVKNCLVRTKKPFARNSIHGALYGPRAAPCTRCAVAPLPAHHGVRGCGRGARYAQAADDECVLWPRGAVVARCEE